MSRQFLAPGQPSLATDKATPPVWRVDQHELVVTNPRDASHLLADLMRATTKLASWVAVMIREWLVMRRRTVCSESRWGAERSAFRRFC